MLFCIVYIGFSLAFYSSFGHRVYEYRNLETTFKSNVAVLAGEADFYPELVLANRYVHNRRFCLPVHPAMSVRPSLWIRSR